MPAFAMAVRRGCGTRSRGGIYAECGMALPGEPGMPLEHFIVDPPIPIEPSAIGLAPVGVKLIERDGVWYLWDWVGEKFYPNVADFLEEVRRFGLSRGPIPKGLDFSKLTAESRIVLVHRRAWIEERGPYYEDWRPIPDLTWEFCPKNARHHIEVNQGHAVTPESEVMCAGLWWQDLEYEKDKTICEAENPRDVTVKMPSFSYRAAMMPAGHVPGYGPAIFVSFPMHRLVVVNDPEGGKHEEAMESASEAGMPVDLVED